MIFPGKILMGRTKRRRSKKDANKSPANLNDQSIINLQKWLVKNGWKNETKLILKSFPQTGRGLTSKLSMKRNEILITIPFNVMITYASLKTHSLFTCINERLTMHELLSLFLLYEKDKKEQSFWKTYLASLPEDLPPLPWQATTEEIKSMPLDLQIISKTMHENFKKSLDRVKKSIKKPLDCVLDENVFKWAYTMVNTRAVYIDPNLGCADSSADLLLDEPSIALCPFLDMFNHHFLANTEAVLKFDGEMIYQLRTLTDCRKHDQVFISYGPHDNVKLLMEYGFFIPGNTYDTVKFHLEEVIKLLVLNFNQQEYRFIREHAFVENLYIGLDGLSYNFKALLYVAFNEKSQNYRSVIFADAYPDGFHKSLPCSYQVLLDHKHSVFEKDYEKLRCCDSNSEIGKITRNFVQYRLDFVDALRIQFCGGKNFT
ncbi:hypothetical protein JTB14_038319 [Gonioctena quinquepunctata]|nr:hypothetical protein JTB14_038319 [Gonioctena quinquepunctata]